jgi:hypothetical protein
MTRTQLHRSIAARTGESMAVIRRLGFHLQADPRDEPPPDVVHLVLDCPFCRRQVAYPGRSGDGSATLAECEDCDIYFEFEDRDVFPASSRATGNPSPGRRRYIPA